MKFDASGKRISSYVTPEVKVAGVTPEVIHELAECGVWNSSIKIVADMTASTVEANQVFEILVKMSRQEQ